MDLYTRNIKKAANVTKWMVLYSLILTAESCWPPFETHFILSFTNPFMFHKKRSMQSCTICCQVSIHRTAARAALWHPKEHRYPTSHVSHESKGKFCCHNVKKLLCIHIVLVVPGAGRASSLADNAVSGTTKDAGAQHPACMEGTAHTVCFLVIFPLWTSWESRQRDSQKKKKEGGKSPC